MAKRMDGLWRIVAFLWSFVAAFVASIAVVVGIVWGAIDVFWQLITGSDGLSASSWPADLVSRTLRWPVDLQVYAYTGAGEMMWLP